MVFNRFSIRVIIRILLMAATMFAAIWSYFTTDFLMSPIGFGVLTIAQLMMLVHYINKNREDLLQFFRSFDYRDFNKAYNESILGNSKDELKVAFNNVLKTFSQLSVEREEQYQYLRLVNEHVSVGLISYQSDGRIDLMNTIARLLLDMPELGRIDQIANHDESLWQQIQNLKPGEKTILQPSQSNVKLAAVSKNFRLAKDEYVLISFQDITSELEAGEMDAWQKLIRVLTHEIMNSVTPVVSLTTAIRQIMQDDKGLLKEEMIDKEDYEDIFKSILAIEKRGQGLLGFVKAYRNYTRPPVPELDRVNLSSLINDTVRIVKPELGTIQFNISKDISADVFIQADDKLISQVLINLIKNAAEAMNGKANAKINIGVRGEGESIYLEVTDNGPGIPEDIITEIFVPFFTTKKQGNGIGLSLSKQIMKAHKGDITATSSKLGTTFTLNFLA